MFDDELRRPTRWANLENRVASTAHRDLRRIVGGNAAEPEQVTRDERRRQRYPAHPRRQLWCAATSGLLEEVLLAAQGVRAAASPVAGGTLEEELVALPVAKVIGPLGEVVADGS